MATSMTMLSICTNTDSPRLAIGLGRQPARWAADYGALGLPRQSAYTGNTMLDALSFERYTRSVAWT